MSDEWSGGPTEEFVEMLEDRHKTHVNGMLLVVLAVMAMLIGAIFLVVSVPEFRKALMPESERQKLEAR